MAEWTLDDFLFNCSDVYPFDTKDANKIEKLMNNYKTTISNEIDKSRKKYDFEKLFELIKKNYKFTKMPGIPFILEKLPSAVKIPSFYITGNLKELVCILGKKDKEGNWTYSYHQRTLCTTGEGRYIGDVLKELRAKFDMVKEFTFPAGSSLLQHDKVNRCFSIYKPTEELGEFGYPVEKKEVFFEY